MASCPTNRLGSTAIPDKPITEHDTQKIEKMYKCTVSRTAYDEWYKEKMAKKCGVDSCITTEESKKKCAKCVFPFTVWGTTYHACTDRGENAPWCSTKTDDNGVHQSGNWGFCNMDKCQDELELACKEDSCITTKDSTQKCTNCTFPFTYKGITHTACTFYGGYSKPWCGTKVDENGVYQSGNWGYCNMDKCTDELTQACESDSCITTRESAKKCTKCVFPFTVWGQTFNTCTSVGEPAPWCSTKTDENGKHQTGHWGFCDESKCPT